MRDSGRLALANVIITRATCRTATHARTVFDADEAVVVALGITFDFSVFQTAIVAFCQLNFDIFDAIRIFKLVSFNARIIRAEWVITVSAAIWAVNVTGTFRFTKNISQVAFLLAGSGRTVFYARDEVFLAVGFAQICQILLSKNVVLVHLRLPS